MTHFVRQMCCPDSLVYEDSPGERRYLCIHFMLQCSVKILYYFFWEQNSKCFPACLCTRSINRLNTLDGR